MTDHGAIDLDETRRKLGWVKHDGYAAWSLVAETEVLIAAVEALREYIEKLNGELAEYKLCTVDRAVAEALRECGTDLLAALEMFTAFNPTCHRATMSDLNGITHCGQCAVCMATIAIAKARQGEAQNG